MSPGDGGAAPQLCICVNQRIHFDSLLPKVAGTVWNGDLTQACTTTSTCVLHERICISGLSNVPQPEV